MLETVKMLLGIDSSDTSKDNILNHYINMAIKMANEYCNQTLSTDYNDEIAELAVYIYRNKDNIGYKSISITDDKSIVFQGNIPNSIKLSLPTPKLTIGV